jgi:YD repeat-containing protein
MFISIFVSVIAYAGSVTYTYDDLNRLIKAEYEDGRVIQYTYDAAGNRTVTYESTTSPITTADPQGGLYSSASVSLICADFSGTGCDKTHYTTDSTTPTTQSPVYSSPIYISETTTLKFFSTDLASNSETVRTQTYTIDSTAPTGTITINSGAASTNSVNVTLTLTCDDAQGCSQMKFANDVDNEANYSTPETYSATKAWALSSGVGAKTVYAKFKDAVGNWSAAYSDTIEYSGEWLSGWSYRKSVTLSRSSGAVTNYQMRLPVGETSGASGEGVDCNGHAQADFDDLRFTTSDGATLLDYWIESISGTTPNRLATVWIKFDSIGTDATTFHMYYGKSDASAASNGEATFLFFDDFPGNSLDSGKWTVEQGDVTVGSGIATLSGTTGTRGYVKTAPIGGINMAARFRIKTSSTTITYGHPVDFRIDANNLIYFFGTPSSNLLTVTSYAGGSYSQINFSVADPSVNYECWDLTWISNEVKVIQSGTTRLTKTTNIPSNGSPVIYMREGTVAGQNIQMDWLLLRQYVSSEPAWGSWGAEQAS